MLDKIKNNMLKLYAWMYANKEKVIRVAAITFVVVGIILLTTHNLYAAGTDDIYTKVKELLQGGFGKGIAGIGFLVGGIMLFLGNMQLGIIIILGALLIAFAPTLVDAIFG